MGKLKKEVRDLDGLRFMMNMLKEVRQRESGITMEINPIMNMYQVNGSKDICTQPAPQAVLVGENWQSFVVEVVQ